MNAANVPCVEFAQLHAFAQCHTSSLHVSRSVAVYGTLSPSPEHHLFIPRVPEPTGVKKNTHLHSAAPRKAYSCIGHGDNSEYQSRSQRSSWRYPGAQASDPGSSWLSLPQPIPVRHPLVFSSLVLSAPEVRGARPTDLKGTVPILKFVELLKQRFGTAQRRRCSLITSATLSFRMPKAI